jgi:hypothetical protein
MELCQKSSQEIMYADGRNNPTNGFVMLNTQTSWYMYVVIGKQFTAVAKEVNKAIKQIHGPNNELPNVVIKALQTTMAAAMAANGVDHWRCDTEAPEEVEKLAKRMVKFVQNLLWFTDAELGFHDVRLRQGLLHFFEDVCKSWKNESESYGYSLSRLNVRTAKNGSGMGRALVDLNPAPAKKAKTAATALTGGGGGGGGTASLINSFSGIDEKLSLRVKTMVQLKITNLQDPRKVEYVVLSGAQDMKKVHHLMAYLTG